MLPLLLEICFPCLLRVKPCVPLNDVPFCRRYLPLSVSFEGRRLLGWNVLAGWKNRRKSGYSTKQAGVFL
jgi:hypothetical protein